MTERAVLWFSPGRKGGGFEWVSNYKGSLVGLCSRRFCEVCDETEWEKMKDFRGGKLEVILTLHYRPVWGEKRFYLGHLAKVLVEKIFERDEGIEFEISKLNALLVNTEKGAVLIDPGGYNGNGSILSSLIANHQIKATIITHGHLDHWNQLHLLEANPIFMGPLTFQLMSRHFVLEGNSKLMRVLEWREEVYPGQPFNLADLPIRVDTFSIPHSIPETMGLLIKGKKRRLIHLGDFKLNGMEVRQKAEIISLLEEIAKEGIDLLSLNIVNAHLPGFTPLENGIIGNLTDILVKAKERVIVTSFSTNLERIERIAEIARLLKRKVEFYGSGMKNARELLKEIFEFELEKEEDGKRSIIFVTGCQAEEDSILWRIANDRDSPLALRLTDVLVFSSRCIPGNEIALRNLITALRPKVEKIVVNEGEIEQLGLKDRGVEERPVHVSGHEQKEGLRLVLEILRPKQILAWPKISPQIEAFKEIADPLGIEVIDEEQRVIEL